MNVSDPVGGRHAPCVDDGDPLGPNLQDTDRAYAIMPRMLGKEELLRVGLDAHVVGRQKTGNETYVVGLARGLAGRSDIDLTVYVDGEARWPPDGGPIPNLRRLRFRRAQPRIAFELPLRARGDQVDVLHLQYVVPSLAGVPVATTIHDLSFLDVPATIAAAARTAVRSGFFA